LQLLIDTITAAANAKRWTNYCIEHSKSYWNIWKYS